jgi:hypothetical protein
MVVCRSFMSGIASVTDFAATGTIATVVVQATGTYYLSGEGAEEASPAVISIRSRARCYWSRWGKKAPTGITATSKRPGRALEHP